MTDATRGQWSVDPCWAVHGGPFEFATRESFDEVEGQRYQITVPGIFAKLGRAIGWNVSITAVK